jgi:hypothetical protein
MKAEDGFMDVSDSPLRRCRPLEVIEEPRYHCLPTRRLPYECLQSKFLHAALWCIEEGQESGWVTPQSLEVVAYEKISP